jgi:Na+-translocating ferredoxin:NAD+ oxidoreductase RnfD subunit
MNRTFYKPIKGPSDPEKSVFCTSDESSSTSASLEKKRDFVAKMKGYAWGWLKVLIFLGLVATTFSKSTEWGVPQSVVSDMESPRQSIVSIRKI